MGKQRQLEDLRGKGRVRELGADMTDDMTNESYIGNMRCGMSGRGLSEFRMRAVDVIREWPKVLKIMELRIQGKEMMRKEHRFWS